MIPHLRQFEDAKWAESLINIRVLPILHFSITEISLDVDWIFKTEIMRKEVLKYGILDLKLIKLTKNR